MTVVRSRQAAWAEAGLDLLPAVGCVSGGKRPQSAVKGSFFLLLSLLYNYYHHHHYYYHCYYHYYFKVSPME